MDIFSYLHSHSCWIFRFVRCFATAKEKKKEKQNAEKKQKEKEVGIQIIYLMYLGSPHIIFIPRIVHTLTQLAEAKGEHERQLIC